jgi:hypothetical protein
MKKILFIIILNLFLLALFKTERDPVRIIQKTISSIDTIRSISYNQHLERTNPRNTDEIIERDRSFLYKKLPNDSITGAKTHIYYYSEGVTVFEDIYDGNFLLRINNYDSTARFYDLVKHPEFKKSSRFWSKNSPYTVQAILSFTLKNKDIYKIELLNDTLIENIECYCVQTTLEDKSTMPCFNNNLKKYTKIVETSYFYINKNYFYPIKLRFELYDKDDPEKIYFSDHYFFDIIFNPEINNEIFSNFEHNADVYSVQYIDQL